MNPKGFIIVLKTWLPEQLMYIFLGIGFFAWPVSIIIEIQNGTYIYNGNSIRFSLILRSLELMKYFSYFFSILLSVALFYSIKGIFYKTIITLSPEGIYLSQRNKFIEWRNIISINSTKVALVIKYSNGNIFYIPLALFGIRKKRLRRIIEYYWRRYGVRPIDAS